MVRLLMRRRLTAAYPLALAVNAVLPASAYAHVKWFCAYDVAGQPRGLANVLCPDFEFLVGLTILALLSGALVEGTRLGEAMVRSINRVTEFVSDNTETMYRAGAGFFFVAIWAVGGILLTPELKTNSTLISAIQLGIAAGMVSRRTMPLSALGIAVIFATAIWQYGAFHLADYPIFLGIAAYLALTGLQRDLFGLSPLDVVRWSAALTLMWASIEKWAYPEWTFPLLVQHPRMMLGYDPEFFMRAAGAIEFALAFALLLPPLVRRVAAIVLAAMFIAAVAEFGKLDMIGHAMIVVVLVGIVADNHSKSALIRSPYLVPVGFVATLFFYLGIYYVAHAALFGTSIT
jgi:hypothetical protein